jgi:hypothetical protein
VVSALSDLQCWLQTITLLPFHPLPGRSRQQELPACPSNAHVQAVRQSPANPVQDNTPGIDATSYTHWGIPRGRSKEPNDAETTTVVCDAGLTYQKRWGWADVDSTAYSAVAMCEIQREFPPGPG